MIQPKRLVVEFRQPELHSDCCRDCDYCVKDDDYKTPFCSAKIDNLQNYGECEQITEWIDKYVDSHSIENGNFIIEIVQ